MRLPVWHQRARVAALIALTLTTLAGASATAQQITYYDFDSPANSGQFSYSCAAGSGAAANPLFCFNDATGSNANPQFLMDTYPAIIDPNPTDNPPVVSTHDASQMTPAQGSQSSSLWFSVPQKVTNGFTAYFAFKLTPQNGSQADGIAFVVQNALGGGRDQNTGCTEQGSGPTAVATTGQGGCIGYGGIDNSLALEFDTYDNSNFGDPNNNHIALQSCGLNAQSAGLPNSPVHDACTVNLINSSGMSFPALVSSPMTSTATPVPVNLADGNVHQVVVVYNGPNDSPANTIQVYLDPPFVAGTHTPDPSQGATPILQGTYNIASSISPLINSGAANDSAYVGFTAGTGASFEQQEVMAWTFTPHTTVTQQQPLSPAGTPTDFPYGTHTYGVTYPPNGPQTTGITMVVTANTISPVNFAALIGLGPTQFAGTQCQVYDSTGGNCVIYSVSCVETGTSTPVQCPSTVTTSNFIGVAESYDNSIQPTSPGLLQGDPLYSSISSITGDGTTATVTCGTATATGECSVTAGQTVTILGESSTPSFNGTVTVLSVLAPNQFTFSSSISGTASGGFLTSSNVQNIFTNYSPQNIDGTSAGRTQNFSDFVATAVTAVGSQTQLTATTTSPQQGAADLLTATVTAASGQVPGPGSMPTGTVPPIAPSAVTFNTGAAPNLVPIANCVNLPVTATSATTGTATCSYTPGSTGSVTITAQYTDPYHLPSGSTLNLNVIPPYDTAIQVAFGNTTLTWPRTTTESVCVAPAGSATPTGTVRLYDGGTLLTTRTLGSNGCTQWLITPTLSAGTHAMTVSYPGDANNPAGNSAPVVVTVNPASVTMVPICGPASLPYGDQYLCAVGLVYDIGLVKGTLNYSLDGGAPVAVPVNLGIALFSIARPAVASHQLVLSFPAQGNFAAAVPGTETFTVKPAPVEVMLTTSTKSTTLGSPVVLTARVESSSAGAPNGTGVVSFYEGAVLLAAIPVNSGGAATYTTSNLPGGNDTITATYSGGSNYGTDTESLTIRIKP